MEVWVPPVPTKLPFRNRLTDVIFRFVCACNGLKTGYPKVRCLSLFLWFIVAMIFPYIVVNDFWSMPSRRNVSFSDIIRVIGVLNFMVSTYSLMFAVMVKHESVEKLLQGGERDAGDTFKYCLCIFVFLLWTGYSSTKITDLTWAPGHSIFLSFDLLSTSFVMIYLDVLRKIRVQLEKLASLTRREKIDWDAVISEKMLVRDQIQTINTLFARPLATTYMQAFVIIFAVFVTVTIEETPLYEKVLQCSCIVIFIAEQLVTTVRASRIEALCLETEFQLQNLSARNFRQRRCAQRDLIAVFRYREEWDGLKAGCYNLGTGGYLRLLSTMITCAAVVLQFDQKTLRALGELAAEGQAP